MPAPPDDTAQADSPVLSREPAATRVADEVRVVCRTGWATPVHRLSGATRVVWEALERPQEIDDLASSLRIDPADAYFLQAVELLIESDLIRRGPS